MITSNHKRSLVIIPAVFLGIFVISFLIIYPQSTHPHAWLGHYRNANRHVYEHNVALFLNHKIAISQSIEISLMILTAEISRFLHISIPRSLALLLSASKAIYAALIYYIIDKARPAPLTKKLLLMLFLFSCAAIYIPFKHGATYSSAGTPNLWNSETFILLIPMAVISLITIVKTLNKESYHGFKALLIITIACIATFFGTLTKPAFPLSAIPTCFILMLFSKTKKQFIQKGLACLIIFLPSVLFLLHQHSLYTQQIGGISILPFGRISTITPSISLSLIQGIALPLSMICLVQKNASKYTIFSWIFFIFAYLQYIFLYETGSKSGNFAWGFELGLTFLYLFNTADVYRIYPRIAGPKKKFFSMVILPLGALSLLSGICRLFILLFGGSAWPRVH